MHLFRSFASADPNDNDMTRDKLSVHKDDYYTEAYAAAEVVHIEMERKDTREKVVDSYDLIRARYLEKMAPRRKNSFIDHETKWCSDDKCKFEHREHPFPADRNPEAECDCRSGKTNKDCNHKNWNTDQRQWHEAQKRKFLPGDVEELPDLDATCGVDSTNYDVRGW